MLNRTVSLLTVAFIAAAGLTTLAAIPALAVGGPPPQVVTPVDGSTVYLSRNPSVELNTRQQAPGEIWRVQVRCTVDGEIMLEGLHRRPARRGPNVSGTSR